MATAFPWSAPFRFSWCTWRCIAAFFLKFHWSYLVVCLALYYVRMFFVTAGYHRYFSHRSFKTSRAFQFIMALVATSSTQKGVLWWAANHRHHHQLFGHRRRPALAFAARLSVVARGLDSVRPLQQDARRTDSGLQQVSGAALAE